MWLISTFLAIGIILTIILIYNRPQQEEDYRLLGQIGLGDRIKNLTVNPLFAVLEEEVPLRHKWAVGGGKTRYIHSNRIRKPVGLQNNE